MADPQILDQMRTDWNDRAREDARYYVAFGRRGQPDDEFFASASDVVRALEHELNRLPRQTPPTARRALEVGCGPGRLLRPMSPHFGEIHGADVSDEMIRLAEERFRGSSGVHLHVTNGADLSPLAGNYFDFVYSYAVFQHIPSLEVVLAYFAEIRRVLKDEGIARLQLNGLPPDSKAPNTWEGVRFSADEVAGYARAHDFQLLALEGAGTQYLWTTWRKQPAGWRAGLRKAGSQARIERSGDAHTGEPVVPASGRFAYASFWIEGLPPDCDLNDLRVTFDGAPGTPCYIGPPEWGGLHQLNVLVPRGLRTGIIPVELLWLGAPLCAPAWLRVIPPGPAVPRVLSVRDGTNLLAGSRIESGTVKVTLEDLADSEAVTVAIDGRPLTGLEWFETDARAGSFELNIRLPADLNRGSHQIDLRQRSRRFPPLVIEVV
ncbi:MAG TPA: methyltransferase domain-containing protein [Bryobacterales bacterium]|nr:methyltransferase domain-containing protein [Bryobacterales bacterium]